MSDVTRCVAYRTLLLSAVVVATQTTEACDRIESPWPTTEIHISTVIAAVC